MFTGQVAVISNKATYLSSVRDLVDDETGTTTDLSNPALTVDIVVTIKDMDCQHTIVTASIANGKVTIPGPGYQYQLEISDLSNLCSGTYRLGEKVTIDDFVNDVIDGTIVIVEGN